MGTVRVGTVRVGTISMGTIRVGTIRVGTVGHICAIFATCSHIGRNIYYSSTYMQYLRDYRVRISLPISYLVTD